MKDLDDKNLYMQEFAGVSPGLAECVSGSVHFSTRIRLLASRQIFKDVFNGNRTIQSLAVAVFILQLRRAQSWQICRLLSNIVERIFQNFILRFVGVVDLVVFHRKR